MRFRYLGPLQVSMRTGWRAVRGAKVRRQEHAGQLIADDADLVELAAQAHIPTNAILTAADRDELRTYENQSRDAVGSFVAAASAQILGRTNR